MSEVENMEILSSDDDSVLQYQQLLESFEELELQLPSSDNDYSNFLSTNQSCIEKVETLIQNEEDIKCSYFLALLNIRESLFEQRNLLLNLCGSGSENLIEKQIEQSTIVNENVTIPQSTPNAKNLNDLVGLNDVKQVLIEAIIYPIKYPQIFTGSRKPWNKILLYGPPGTGKTYIANAIAAEIDACFYNISSADLLSKYIGESEKLIQEFFHQISRSQNRNIVLIDEIDSLCKQRASDEADHTRRIKTQLLTALQNLNDKEMILICTTNCPWDIDSAFMRRFQRKIYVPLPNSEERHEILLKHMVGTSIEILDEDWKVICDNTEGYSGSDLAVLANYVLYEPVRELESVNYWAISADGFFTPASGMNAANAKITMCNVNELDSSQVRVRSVILEDFLNAFKFIRKSVQDTELKKFDEYRIKCAI